MFCVHVEHITVVFPRGRTSYTGWCEPSSLPGCDARANCCPAAGRRTEPEHRWERSWRTRRPRRGCRWRRGLAGERTRAAPSCPAWARRTRSNSQRSRAHRAGRQRLSWWQTWRRRHTSRCPRRRRRWRRRSSQCRSCLVFRGCVDASSWWWAVKCRSAAYIEPGITRNDYFHNTFIAVSATRPRGILRLRLFDAFFK